MTTPAKIAANRQNARRSTGPRDTSRTCQNALAHGLTAKGLSEFDDHCHYRTALASLKAELQPQGTLENFLVQRIVLGVVRVQRAARLEAEFVNAKYSGLSWPPRCVDDESIGQLADGFSRYEAAHQNLLLRALRELRDLQRERRANPRPPEGEGAVASFRESAPATATEAQ